MFHGLRSFLWLDFSFRKGQDTPLLTLLQSTSLGYISMPGLLPRRRNRLPGILDSLAGFLHRFASLLHRMACDFLCRVGGFLHGLAGFLTSGFQRLTGFLGGLLHGGAGFLSRSARLGGLRLGLLIASGRQGSNNRYNTQNPYQ
jgi:hypothetical protein